MHCPVGARRRAPGARRCVDASTARLHASRHRQTRVRARTVPFSCSGGIVSGASRECHASVIKCHTRRGGRTRRSARRLRRPAAVLLSELSRRRGGRVGIGKSTGIGRYWVFGIKALHRGGPTHYVGVHATEHFTLRPAASSGTRSAHGLLSGCTCSSTGYVRVARHLCECESAG